MRNFQAVVLYEPEHIVKFMKVYMGFAGLNFKDMFLKKME